MIKSYAIIALLFADLGPEALNCPQPQGNITVDGISGSAWPLHIERIMPPILEVDVACRIDRDGRFVECRYSPRQRLDERQQSLLSRAMTRTMSAISSDVPGQRCVATTMRWQFAGEVSEPSPDEAAGKGEIPDRPDQDSG